MMRLIQRSEKKIFHPEKEKIESQRKLGDLLEDARLEAKDFGEGYQLGEKYRINGGIPTEVEFGKIYDSLPKKLKAKADAIRESLYPKEGLKAKAEDGEIYGFVKDGVAHFNADALDPNTLIHEAGHLWIDWASKERPDLHEAGMKKVEGSKYLEDVKSDKFYQSEAEKLPEAQREAYYKMEALAKAIGDNGEKFATESERTSFKQWVMNIAP